MCSIYYLERYPKGTQDNRLRQKNKQQHKLKASFSRFMAEHVDT
jgi:hypothetical protein